MIEERGKFLIPGIYIGMLLLAGFLYYILEFFLRDYMLENSILQMAFYLPAYILLIVLFIPAWFKSFKHAAKHWRNVLKYIGIGLLLMFIGMIAIGLIYELIGITETSDNQEFLDSLAIDGTIYDRINLVIFAVIMAPLVEEMVFRNALFQILKTNNFLPMNVIITISAFIFGFMHTGFADLVQVFYYAGLGAVLGYIYYKSDSIVAPMTVHLLYNAYGAYLMLTTL